MRLLLQFVYSDQRCWFKTIIGAPASVIYFTFANSTIKCNNVIFIYNPLSEMKKEPFLTPQTSSVYVIASMDNSKIKIGKANDVLRRIETFSYVEINYAKSLEIVCRDEKAAHKIEKMLHNRFDDYRLLSSDMGNHDGSSEWFSYKIYEQIEKFIRDSNDERIASINVGIKFFKKENLFNKRQYLTKKERDLRKQQQWLENDIANEEKIYTVIKILQNISTKKNVQLFSIIKNPEEIFYCLYLEMDDKLSDISKKQARQLRATILKTPNGIGDLCLSVLYTMENNPQTWIYELVIKKNNPFFNFPEDSKTSKIFQKLYEVCSELFKPLTDFGKIPGNFWELHLLMRK